MVENTEAHKGPEVPRATRHPTGEHWVRLEPEVARGTRHTTGEHWSKRGARGGQGHQAPHWRTLGKTGEHKEPGNTRGQRMPGPQGTPLENTAEHNRPEVARATRHPTGEHWGTQGARGRHGHQAPRWGGTRRGRGCQGHQAPHWGTLGITRSQRLPVLPGIRLGNTGEHWGSF